MLLSEPALRKAYTGFYRGRALQNLPADLLARYFTPKDDGYMISDALRALVRFESLNLLDPFPPYAASVLTQALSRLLPVCRQPLVDQRDGAIDDRVPHPELLADQLHEPVGALDIRHAVVQRPRRR